MKVIVAGGRDIEDVALVANAINASGFDFTEVVSGGVQGVDSIGEGLARLFGIPVHVFPADWMRHGRAAGPIRNRQMAEYADALVAVWDGHSRGTKNMIAEMEKLGKPVYIAKAPLPEEPEPGEAA